MSDTPSKTASPADDDIDLGRLFGLLLDHKGWIIAITALFSVMGIIHAQLATPIYRADALVQVESKPGGDPLADMGSMFGQETKASAELGIMRSRLVLGRAVDQENLDLVVAPRRLPVVGDFLVRRGVERPPFSHELITRSVWAGEAINIGEFQVAPHLEGSGFTIVTGEDNRYVLRLGEETLGEGELGQNATFLDGQVQLRVAEIQAAPGAEFMLTKRPRLAAINGLRGGFSVSQQGNDSGLFDLAFNDPDPQRAQRALDAISQVYLTQNVQRQSAEAEQSLEFLEEQTPKVRDQLREAEDALNAYRTQQDSVDLSMETQAVLQRLVSLESQLNELEFAESEISRRFSPGHPTYQSLIEKRQQLERERERLDERVGNLPETQQQILRRTRDVEVTQQIYVQLLNKIQEMNIARASTVGNVRILDSAVVQGSPVAPKKRSIVLLATLLGGLLAVGLVLLRGLLNRGVESPEQIEQAGLPVYATVPLSDVQAKLIKRIKRRGDKHGSAVATGVLAHKAPTDTSVEALRALRTNLHFAMMEAGNNRLVITGPSPDVGKSFISINLAAVCAQAGQKVLVVDADMRKGHVHYAFNGKAEGGLSELLAGKVSFDDSLRDGNLPGLSYIARGSAPPNPSELLLNQRFSEFLDEASRRFDLVIIDTPPILAVTDAAVVGKLCGTSLMVLRFQRNPIKELHIAQRRMETAGITVKGAILNAMERKAATSYGYGYYNYAYK